MVSVHCLPTAITYAASQGTRNPFGGPMLDRQCSHQELLATDVLWAQRDMASYCTHMRETSIIARAQPTYDGTDAVQSGNKEMTLLAKPIVMPFRRRYRVPPCQSMRSQSLRTCSENHAWLDQMNQCQHPFTHTAHHQQTVHRNEVNLELPQITHRQHRAGRRAK